MKREQIGHVAPSAAPHRSKDHLGAVTPVLDGPSSRHLVNLTSYVLELEVFIALPSFSTYDPLPVAFQTAMAGDAREDGDLS